MLSNSVGTQMNSVLPEGNCKRLTKPSLNKNTSSKSEGGIEELRAEEYYVVTNNRRLPSSGKETDYFTSKQEYGSECERNKTPRRDSRKEGKLLQVRTPSDETHSPQLTKSKIADEKPSAKFLNENEKNKKGYLSKEPEADHESKISRNRQDQILEKGPVIEELPCGESAKWRYIRMYQERNRRREARRRRQKQKEREEAQRSGRRRSTKKRRKSKKRSKSRSRRKSKGRKSKSRSRSRRRSRSRKSSTPRSRGSSRSRGRRSSTRHKRRQG